MRKKETPTEIPFEDIPHMHPKDNRPIEPEIEKGEYLTGQQYFEANQQSNVDPLMASILASLCNPIKK